MSTQAGVPFGQGVSRVGIAPPRRCEGGHGATGVRQFPWLAARAQNRPPPVPPPPKPPPPRPPPPPKPPPPKPPPPPNPPPPKPPPPQKIGGERLPRLFPNTCFLGGGVVGRSAKSH